MSQVLFIVFDLVSDVFPQGSTVHTRISAGYDQDLIIHLKDLSVYRQFFNFYRRILGLYRHLFQVYRQLS